MNSELIFIWHWVVANSVPLLVLTCMASSLCTLWLALHVRTLSVKLRAASRTAQQAAAQFETLSRWHAECSLRLEILEHQGNGPERTTGTVNALPLGRIRKDVLGLINEWDHDASKVERDADQPPSLEPVK